MRDAQNLDNSRVEPLLAFKLFTVVKGISRRLITQIHPVRREFGPAQKRGPARSLAYLETAGAS